MATLSQNTANSSTLSQTLVHKEDWFERYPFAAEREPAPCPCQSHLLAYVDIVAKRHGWPRKVAPGFLACCPRRLDARDQQAKQPPQRQQQEAKSCECQPPLERPPDQPQAPPHEPTAWTRSCGSRESAAKTAQSLEIAVFEYP